MCFWRQTYVPMVGSKLLGPKRCKKRAKAQDSRIFASNLLRPRNTDLGCNYVTPVPCRMFMVPKGLRAGC